MPKLCAGIAHNSSQEAWLLFSPPLLNNCKVEPGETSTIVLLVYIFVQSVIHLLYYFLSYALFIHSKHINSTSIIVNLDSDGPVLAFFTDGLVVIESSNE